MELIIFLILSYLIGSIPFGLIVTKVAGLGDIRKIGSGNIGATNVLRTGNKKLAAATLFFDGGKGAFAIFIIGLLFPYQPMLALLCGLAAIIGHCFPIWLKFKGGKGVATTLGVLLAAVPLTGLIACATWLLSALILRISSLSAMIAMMIAPVATFFIYGVAPAIICLLIALLVIVMHRANIKRLLKGEEPKIGAKK